MKNLSAKSCYLRLKDSLASDTKVALIDKEGQFTQKEAFAIYCGFMNQISRYVKKGIVCLIAPFMRKETPLLIAAVISLGGIVLIGDPHETKESFLKEIIAFTDFDIGFFYRDNKWHLDTKKNILDVFIKEDELKVKPLLRASKTRPSFYVFTAGSTGKKRVVALSEYSLLNNLIRQKSDTGDENSIGYLCLPLHHIFGIGAQLQYLCLGKTAFISDTRHVDYALDMIEKHRCTTIANVPTFFNMLINEQNNHRRDISSLKYGVVAGGAYSKEQFCYFEQQLDMSLCSSYGMTEGSTGIANASYDTPLSLKSLGVGRPLKGTDVVLKNDDFSINKKEGELCFKGFNLMLGYLSKKGLELPLDNDGYFHTGDLARIDENGIIQIIGRMKNIVIRGGENISCEFLEQEIMKIKGIVDVCVTGVKDEKYSEVVGAYIVSDYYQNPDGLIEILKTKLKRIEAPAVIILGKEIPLLSSGKHDIKTVKTLLNNQYSKNKIN